MSISWRAVFQKQEAIFQLINQMQVLYLFLDTLNSVLAFVGQHWAFGLCLNPTYWYILSKTCENTTCSILTLLTVQSSVWRTLLERVQASPTVITWLALVSVFKFNVVCSALTVVRPGYLCYARNWSVRGTRLAVKRALETLTPTGWLSPGTCLI